MTNTSYRNKKELLYVCTATHVATTTTTDMLPLTTDDAITYLKENKDHVHNIGDQDVKHTSEKMWHILNSTQKEMQVQKKIILQQVNHPHLIANCMISR